MEKELKGSTPSIAAARDQIPGVLDVACALASWAEKKPDCAYRRRDERCENILESFRSQRASFLRRYDAILGLKSQCLSKSHFPTISTV